MGGVGGQGHAPGALCLRNRASTHCTKRLAGTQDPLGQMHKFYSPGICVPFYYLTHYIIVV